MKAIRLQRFKAFEDSGWIEFKPITLLFGYNSAGKSSILQALLMLKQSLQNPALEVPFVFSSDKGVDLGAFQDVVFQHKIDHGKPMVISMKVEIPEEFYISLIGRKNQYSKSELEILQDYDFRVLEDINLNKSVLFEYSIEISYNKKERFIDILGFNIKCPLQKNIFGLNKSRTGANAKATYFSDYFDLTGKKIPLSWYNFFPLIKSEDNFIELSKITEMIMQKVKDTLNRLVNIGPIRAKPDRSMLFTGERPSNVGSRGEDTFKLLYSDKYSEYSKHLEKKINKWLLNYGYVFEWNMQKSNRGEFVLNELIDEKKKIFANIVDVGFGISQILPIAVQLYALEHDGILLIEQPEIHLHSRAQADLADLFIDAANEEKLYILAETHSENLLLRLRRRMAEGLIKHDNVGVYFVQHKNGSSRVLEVDINEFGDIENIPEEFKDFFQEDFNDLMELHLAQGRIKN